jgi:hypothetical protein
MDNNDDRANVVNFPKQSNHALFNSGLRSKLEDGMKPFTEKHVEAVETLEHVLCTYLVTAVRSFAMRLATRAGEKAAKKVIGMR